MKRYLLIGTILLLLLAACNGGDAGTGNTDPAGEAPAVNETDTARTPTVIDVDVASIEGGEVVVLGDLSIGVGDTIAYNIAYAGDGNVQVGFVVAGQDPGDPQSRAYLSLSSFGGGDLKSTITSELVGMYSLYIRTLGDDAIENVAGTVVIQPV